MYMYIQKIPNRQLLNKKNPKVMYSFCIKALMYFVANLIDFVDIWM